MSLMLQLFFFNNKNDAQQKYRIGHTTILPFFFWKLPWHQWFARWCFFVPLAFVEGWVHGGFVASCSWGFSSVVCNGWRVKQKAMRFDFWVGEFFNLRIFGLSSFFSYVFPPWIIWGSFPRVWGWEVGDSGTSISRSPKKTQGTRSEINKESPPTKKSHSDSCLKNHLINIFWFGLLRVLYTFLLDETIFTICWCG